MQDADVENVLTNEPTIDPSAGLSRRVMAAVRREAAEQQGLLFPWRIFFSGLAISATVILAAALAARGGTMSASTEIGPFSEVLAWLSMTGAGSFVIVWWSLRLTSRP